MNARNFVLCVALDQVTLKGVVKVGTCPDWKRSWRETSHVLRTCCEMFHEDDLKEKGCTCEVYVFMTVCLA